ncbi:MAG: Gfo/Idh/MocA family oxidoreductase [Vicinamibacteria bacterium]
MSPGNGHPFSFSAIVNGFDPTRFAEAGWPVIHEYLGRQPPDAFGFEGVRVTHAWTQDSEVTRRLCFACSIEHACLRLQDLVDSVDAVILARDDWESHAEMALLALDGGKPVFVDKPLTLDAGELRRLAPYLEQGRLMSTSGLRFARELEPLRQNGQSLGRMRLVEGVVLNDLAAYGVHLLDAVSGLGLGVPVGVRRIHTEHEAFLFELDSGVPFTLHCLGSVARTFRLHFFGDEGHAGFDLHDNFAAFRRTLAEFFTMCRSGRAPIAPAQTIGIMKAIMLARHLAPGEAARVDPHA